MTSSPQGSNIESNLGVFVRSKIALAVSFSLLGVAAISWVASYYLMPFMMSSSSSDMMMTGTGVAAIVSSSSPLSTWAVLLFEIIWVVGMAAMMFPAMIPIVLFYNRVSTKLIRNQRLARLFATPLFLSGYLATYAILGLGAYISVYFALRFSMSLSSGLLSYLAVAAPAGILFATGIYQFTSLKFKCLSGCASPLGFFGTRTRSGLSGSFSMGFSHGLYCVGCCLLYMLVMLVVGAMSIPIMAILTGVIAVEKVIVKGSIWFARFVGFMFIFGGILVLAFPSLLTFL